MLDARQFAREFVGFRTRLQRFSDCAFFEGWIIDMASDRVTARITTNPTFSPGQDFFAEFHGRSGRGSCRIRLMAVVHDSMDGLSKLSDSGQKEMTCAFQMLEQVRQGQSTQSFRMYVPPIPSTIFCDMIPNEAQLVEIGEGLAEFVCDFPIDPKQNVTIQVCAPAGLINFNGRVTGCTPTGNVGVAYRIAVNIEPAHRIDSAKWSHFLSGHAA